MKVYLWTLQLNILVSCFITSLVYERKLQKMELRLPHMLHLFNVFRENKDTDNCAQLLEEECNNMFGVKSLNDELIICKATSLGMLCLMK